jgi:hypothetical protein
MAKVIFPDFIQSASGIISRKRMADGSVRSLVVTKKGTLYETTFRQRTCISPEEKAQRARFGTICSAFAIAQKELHIPSDPETRKRAYAVMGGIYDRMATNHKIASPKALASVYAYFVW